MSKILAAMAAALMLAACASVVPPTATFQVQVGAPAPLSGMGGGQTAVDVTVTNTGKRSAERVALSCQFFDAGGAAVNTGASFFYNLAAGASDTNRMFVMTPGVVRGDCVAR